MKKLFYVFIIMMAIACSKHPKADLVVMGRIWTGNSAAPYAEAMAVNGDSIVAIGTKDEIEKWAGDNSNKLIADEGKLIVPGFIDAHTHFVEGGFRLSSVILRDAKTKEEFIKRIKEYASKLPAGAWLRGGDWDHMNWGGQLPEKEWVDSVTQNNPVWVNRADGHMAFANSAALKAASVTDKVKDVPGGTIVRNAKGKVTGVFKDNAQTYVDAVVPSPSAAEEDGALYAAMNYVASNGVTSTHVMYDGMETFERARSSNKLITRIYAGTRLSDWAELKAKIDKQGRGDKWLQIGLLKGFVDGSLGSHTAAFFKPFIDAPNDSGFFITPAKDLYEQTSAADKAGLQVTIHAIGDKAIYTLLNIYERIGKENGPRDRRFRMEHVQHIAPKDIPRFAALNVIASMQPYHAIDDGRWAEQIIDHERAKTTYAFNSLMKANAIVAFGSDWFVAPPTPLEGIYGAVTRRTLDDKNPDGWIPEEKITVEQALKAYTMNAAYASFEEKIKGSLEKGKLADFLILDQNILTIAPEKIRDVKVLATVVGGKIVYEPK